MAHKSKRDRREAFEDGGDSFDQTTRRHKKHKSKNHRRESSDHDEAAAQLQRESQESIAPSIAAADKPSLATTAESPKKKRKRKGKNWDAVAASRLSPSHEAGPESSVDITEQSAARTQSVEHSTSEEGAVEQKQKKNKRKKLEKHQHHTDVTTERPEQDADSVAVAGKKKKRSISKKRTVEEREAATAKSLLSRVEDPEDVDPNDIKRAESEDGSKTSDEVENGLQISSRPPLADRIEVPRSPKRKRKSKSKGTISRGDWTLSDGVAGRFLGQDPIMTDDDQYLILPTKYDVRVYSTATSLLVRTLPTGFRTLAVCTISKLDKSKLVVGAEDGTISVWDWTRGKLLQEWQTVKGLRSIVSISSKGPADCELIVTSHQSSYDDRQLAVYALEPSSKQATSLQVLLSRPGLNVDVQILEGAGIIVAYAASRLLIGVAASLQLANYEQSAVTWREFPVPGPISSVDARTYTVQAKPSRQALDVAVGLQTGSIVLYEDLLHRIISKEKKKNDQEVTARFLNWHRGAVNTVRWSRDGNYVISGGNETVLVIWQLDTNKQQYLPHLSTDILRLSISRRGSYYALQLGDNSVMILSTADLSPTTNITLLAVTSKNGNNVPAIMLPTKPGQLLAAIPRSISAEQATSLQTYDLTSDMQISRQALTRNLTTTLNIGPEGQQIREPNVAHMQVGFDGKWLATVEEWSPDASDLMGSLLTEEFDTHQQAREVVIKFWAHDEVENHWELVNRIDQPHGRAQIAALVSNPVRIEFATTGTDGNVGVWTPKSRKRDGVSVRDHKGNQLYNWSVARRVSCSPAMDISTAGLAYSQDGTVLAASYSTTSSGPQWTYLIHHKASDASAYASDLVCSAAQHIASTFVDQYLVTLTATTLSIYDPINAQTVKSVSIGGDFAVHSKRGRHYLTSNPLDGTFAIGLNPTEEFLPARVLVFGLREGLGEPHTASDNPNAKVAVKGALFEGLLDGHITALLPSPTSPGYVTIDSNTQIRQLRGPGNTASNKRSPTGAFETEVARGLDAIFGRATAASSSAVVETTQPNSLDAGDAMDDDRAVGAAGKTLEDVLSFQSSMQVPSVGDLFDRVVGLFRRPRSEREDRPHAELVVAAKA